MSAAEVAVVKARIEAGPLTAYDSRPTTAADYPYVILYSGAGIGTSDREADVRVQHDITFQTTTVGVSSAQVRTALDRLNAQLEDWTPTLTGRRFSKVAHTGSQMVKADEDLPDRVLFYATDQWRVVSDPA